MSHDTPPVFRPLGRFAPVAVNSGLRPETQELTTLKLVIAPQWRTQATEDTFRAHHHETRRTKFL